MLTYCVFFVVISIFEFYNILKNGGIKDTIIYSVFMIVALAFAIFYYSNPARDSFLALVFRIK